MPAGTCRARATVHCTIMTSMATPRQKVATQITAVRPADSILGEEGGQVGEGGPVRWIVDPLDGTVNYLYGLPDWAARAGGWPIPAGAGRPPPAGWNRTSATA